MKIGELMNWKKIGIIFSKKYDDYQVTFPNIKSKNGVPLFKSGIIFTGSADKGAVLNKFLSKFSLKLNKLFL